MFDLALPTLIAFAFLVICALGIVDASRAIGKHPDGQHSRRARLLCSVGPLGFGSAIASHFFRILTGPQLPGAWPALQVVLLVGVFTAFPLLTLRGQPKGLRTMPSQRLRGYPPGVWEPLPWLYSAKVKRLIPTPLRRGIEACMRWLAQQPWLAPANSVRAVGLTFLVLIVLPYFVVSLATMVTAGPAVRSRDVVPVVSALVSTGAGAPLWEETVFRWITAYVAGVPGVIFGSLMWALLHPLEKHLPFLEMLKFGPLWILDAIFYIRIWRGPYYWLSYPVHAVTNISIVVSAYLTGLP